MGNNPNRTVSFSGHLQTMNYPGFVGAKTTPATAGEHGIIFIKPIGWKFQHSLPSQQRECLVLASGWGPSTDMWNNTGMKIGSYPCHFWKNWQKALCRKALAIIWMTCIKRRLRKPEWSSPNGKKQDTQKHRNGSSNMVWEVKQNKWYCQYRTDDIFCFRGVKRIGVKLCPNRHRQRWQDHGHNNSIGLWFQKNIENNVSMPFFLNLLTIISKCDIL